MSQKQTFCEYLPFFPIYTSTTEGWYPHVLTLLNFHGPYNPYKPPPNSHLQQTVHDA